MLTLKRARVWLMCLAVVVAVANTISPLIPKAYADTATAVDFNTKDLPFVRINRTLISVGNTASGIAYFYTADPLGDNYVYNSVGLKCPATLTYAPAQAAGEGVSIPSSWTISWTSPYQGQEGCQTVKSSVQRNDDPKNNGEAERFWTVFYQDGNKINSVLKDNKTTFTKYATAVMPSGTPEQYAYIEDGVQAVDCPSVIRFSQFDNKWAYIPMAKASSGANASDQYKALMNKAFGTPVNDVQCTPIDKDDLGLLKRFGLPESYYDRGTINKNNLETNFGFSGNNLYGAELLGGVPDKSAAGIGANGENANGTGIGNGDGVVSDNPTGGNAKPTCTIEGIGWIVCPVTNFLASIADGAMGILNEMFKVPAAAIFDTNGDTYKYWQQIRNYANIMFVVAFLIIIFSQVTSVGITNYGIKKLLPKLIATAILVNLSFPICAILVDLSNLLGFNLASFLSTSVAGIGSSDPTTAGSQASVFGGIASTVLIGGAVLVTAYFALAAIVGVLISVVAIGVTMVILLGIRQALVILLVVLAPLAFVALLLPNTESLFKKWLNLFKSMLLIFPIASLLYGAGLLASGILMKTSSNIIVQTIGGALPVVMLVAIYKAFNSAMNAVNGVGDFAKGLRNGIGKAGSPLKSLAGASDKLNRQRFKAGEGPIGLRGLGNLVNRTQAGYDAKLKAAKDQTDVNASSHLRTNPGMQKYINQSARATQQNKANQMAIQNAGRQHVLDEHRDSIEDEGRQKEKERELNEKEQTVQINAAGLERSLADVAAQMKQNAEARSSNASKENMNQNHQDLITEESKLSEQARRLDNVKKIIQTVDEGTQQEFIAANTSGENLKEAEATRDANWKDHVKDSPELVEQQTRIQGQQLRGKAADETVNAAVKRNMTAGTMEIDNGDGGTISLRNIRENLQDAEATTKYYEGRTKAQDTERASTDTYLKAMREHTQDAEATTKAGEAVIKAQDTDRAANAADGSELKSAQDVTLHAEMEAKRSEAQLQAQDEEEVATNEDLVEIANETHAQQNRAGEAKRVQTSNYRDAILNPTDSTVVDIAGGTIHPVEGQQRAQASARAEVNRARTEVIANARIQFETASNDSEAVSIATTGRRLPPPGSPAGTLGPQASAEDIEAASLHLLERGAHGDKMEVIRNIAAVTAGISDPDQRQALRSSVADAYVKSSLADLGGKDFAGQLRNPGTTPDFDAKIRSSLGTLKPEAMAKDLKYANTVLDLYNRADATQKATMGPVLDKLITTIRSNSTLSASTDVNTREAIDNITAAMGSAYSGPGTWSS